MTMTDKVSAGLSETLTCAVTVDAAPESVKWYVNDKQQSSNCYF